MTKREITYFAYARNDRGKIEQLFVSRPDGRNHQEWTGKIYRTVREAEADMIELNCGGKQVEK